MPEGSPITAVLGPTNTGKTHRAIERMLEHDSGMIGLPLRLLAREVYDRITSRIGESSVALVTGEEKRVPRRPSYWVCTVEAMPMDREVDFIAIDEIQLASHAQRGHMFTDRLLHARGKKETWFLGAATMRPIISDLVPSARLVEHPRMSLLKWAGTDKLSRLPPRSAVVGFSTTQVYEVAERLRALRGGAAVVLGALSPRTRNAQVAMFQAGEVDYLAATDAIGMGLNLDVTHVAFAGLRKFDGRDVRDLDTAELAQIAGRAGRYLTNGTFGTVAPLALPDGVAAAIEAHKFPSVRRLFWRNSDLDRSSIDTLIASLKARPGQRCLKLVDEAEDTTALQKLSIDPAIRSRARGEAAVGLLWDVCRIPDFRKLLIESHVALLAELYGQLSGPREVLDADWIAAKVAEIDDPSGDIDTLIDRIASIRTWTYISNHTRWVKDAAEWQERTRAIEDRLSDALHERLVQRFVERGAKRSAAPSRARHKPRARSTNEAGAASMAGEAGTASAQQGKSKARDSTAGAVKAHPFARLLELREALAPMESRSPRVTDAWVESVVSAPHARFSVDAGGRILDGNRAVGQLTRGVSLLLPEVKIVGHDELGAGARSRILRRLVAYARDLVEELLASLRSPSVRELSAAGRGVVYQLERGLGTALSCDAEEQIAELTARDRELLRALSVELGERVIYVPGLLRRPAIEQRVALCAAYFGGRGAIECPKPSAVSFVPPPRVDPRALAAIGFPLFGGRAVRADVAERVYQAIVEDAEEPRQGEQEEPSEEQALSPVQEEEKQGAGSPSAGPESVPLVSERSARRERDVLSRLASWLGCPTREAARVAEAIAGAREASRQRAVAT